MPYLSYTQSQRFLATLLLFSFLLESCYNPNIGIGKRSIAQAQKASRGNTSHQEKPYGNSREQPTTTTADNSSIESWQTGPDIEQAQEKPGQQGTQGKGKERAAAIVEVSEKPAQPGTASILPLPLVTQPPRQADKAPQHTASQGFLAQEGQQGAENSAGEPSARDQHQEEPSTEGASGSALSHNLPRAPELTERREPTDLKGAQQEAAKLKEEAKWQVVPKLITRFKDLLSENKGPTELKKAQQEVTELKKKMDILNSVLPQATEKADAEVVHDLITHLKDLCRLEQGSDGAKECISRLREAHRTSWGQTAYGASISKQLTALLVHARGQELGLKQLASDRLFDKTPDGVERLVEVLDQLAAFDLKQVAPTGDLSYYTDAAILYQNILRIYEEEKEYQEQIEAAYKGLAEIRRDMLARLKGGAGFVAQGNTSYKGLAKIGRCVLARLKGGKSGFVAQCNTSLDQLQKKIKEEVRIDKQFLENLREKSRRKVEELEALLNKQGSQEEELTCEKKYIERSRKLFSDITEDVRKFLARLYQESEEELIPVLGPPPCKYTVIGLGSMALAQMTPYSDLEFAILMEEDNDEAREYLRQLTHLVHFRVINLGETVIPKDKYGINLDHLGKRGINFDLGGKTPLGRNDKPYDLIQPVAGMLHYLRNEGDKIEHIDKNLPYILESTCRVHGDEDLYSAYRGEKSVFLQQEQIHKTRALKRLREGVVEWDYSHPGIAKAKPKQPGNLAAFKPQFNIEDAGRVYDVKQEIYRLLDRLLYGLGMYYMPRGTLPNDGWGKVRTLASNGIIGVGASAQAAAHHLQYAISFATMLRLKTYLHHGQQGERVTMLSGVSPEEAQQAVSKAFLLPEEALQAGGSLFRYYYTALALHSKMESFFEASQGQVSPSKERGFFQEASFYDCSDDTIGNIHLRLLQYKQAVECYKRVRAFIEKFYKLEEPHVAEILNNLGRALDQLGEPQQAIACCEQAKAINEKVHGKEQPEVARSLIDLGRALNQLGELRQATKCYRQAWDILNNLCNKKAYDSEHRESERREVVRSLNNLGRALNQLGDPQQAIACCEQARAINEKAYSSEHPSVARSLNNLGRALNQSDKPKEAIRYLARALEINGRAYGPGHPEVARSLNNLGEAWDQLGKPEKAIEYLKRARAINEKVYGSEHAEVARSLNNLGRAWNQLGEPKQAIECCEQAKAINEKAYGPEHPHVSTILNNLGRAWNQLGKPNKAIGYLVQALESNEQAYGPGHPEVARSLDNLGRTLNQLGELQQAIACCEQAKVINEKVYGAEHPSVATNLNNLGRALNQLGEPKQAIEYYERSLAIYEQVYGKEHPHVAEILNNLGSAFSQLEDPKEATKCYERALAINKQAYGSEHPSVARSLNNLGEAGNQLVDPNKAIGYFTQALEIHNKFYKEEHPYVATLLNNLGRAWDQVGNLKQAIECYEGASDINKQAYRPDLEVATGLNKLALFWRRLGCPMLATDCSKRASEINAKAHKLEHPE